MDEKSEDEKSEEGNFDGPYDIIEDYSDYSTIQGIIYIFFSYQTNFGRFFWILVVIGMLVLGGYWTAQVCRSIIIIKLVLHFISPPPSTFGPIFEKGKMV